MRSPIGDPSLYLRRLGLPPDPGPPTLETLRRLQLAHLLSVPFENLDVLAHRRLSLAPHALMEKVVHRRRGGFCYELNHLFALLLEALGFAPHRLPARVHREDGRPGRPFGHLTLLVPLEGRRWLVDVGFGDAFLQPLDVDDRGEWPQRNVAWRVVPAGQEMRLECRQPGEAWQPRYLFELTPFGIERFLGAFIETQTSPDSWFTWRRLVTRLTPDGRVTLSGDRLIVRRGNERSEQRLTSNDEVRQALLRHFDL